MKVTTPEEAAIHDIRRAFGCYDYRQETGMTAAFSGKDATEDYICAYVRGMLLGGYLHSTSQRGEGYIAYKLLGEKMGFPTEVLAISLFLGVAALSVWDGIRNEFGFLNFFVRSLVMLYATDIYDILFFGWVLLCHSNFFPTSIPS